jgi:hypothetical protein
MTQRVRFVFPVYQDGTKLRVETGDTVVLVTRSGTGTTETLTNVGHTAHWIEWDSSVNGTRSSDIFHVASIHRGLCEDLEDTGNYLLDSNGDQILDSEENPIPIAA